MGRAPYLPFQLKQRQSLLKLPREALTEAWLRAMKHILIHEEDYLTRPLLREWLSEARYRVRTDPSVFRLKCARSFAQSPGNPSSSSCITRPSLRRLMMSSLPDDHNSSRDPDSVASADTTARSGGGDNPLWLLIFAGALFFAFAAALLASG